MKKIFVAIVLIASLSASAQVKIGDNPTVLNAGALLELQSDAGNKGLKFPEVALTSTTAWLPLAGDKVMGMTVYNTATIGDVTPGLYTNNGTVWVKLGGSPLYQNIAGDIQTFTSTGTISDNTYFAIWNGSANGSLITPTVAVGKTFMVKNITNSATSTSVTVAGQVLNSLKGRTFVSDGITWYMITP